MSLLGSIIRWMQSEHGQKSATQSAQMAVLFFLSGGVIVSLPGGWIYIAACWLGSLFGMFSPSTLWRCLSAFVFCYFAYSFINDLVAKTQRVPALPTKLAHCNTQCLSLNAFDHSYSTFRHSFVILF